MVKIEDVNITWLGHAGFKIKTPSNKIIYIDPYVIKDENIEAADYILITHDHYDHLCKDTINKLTKQNTEIIGTPSCISKAEGNLRIMPNDEKKVFPDFELWSVPAYNREKQFHPRGFVNGYVLVFPTLTIYHAGDTDFIPEMEKLKKFDIDVALLPVGGTYTMDVREAVKAVRAIKPKKVWPMHYGTIEGTEADINQLKQLIKNYELNVEVITE